MGALCDNMTSSKKPLKTGSAYRIATPSEEDRATTYIIILLKLTLV